MESFFGALKDACGRDTFSSSHDEASSALFVSIEAYDHRIRRHSTLGDMSPLQDENMGGVPMLQNV
jgi:putative transposase